MPRIEQRTVIAFGRSGYCVTLPKSWVEYYGLKKGDKLEMVTNDEIIIRIPRSTMAGVSS